MESLGRNFEKPIAADIGFQPEVIPEGVPESELVDFFMEHLSAPKPEGISEQYHEAELVYYRRQAGFAFEKMEDEEQRERLRKFLNHE
jgi:hypothetical protein